MAIQKKEIIIEVPHRISGFFEIVDELNGIKINNPERIGSRGAGFNLSAVGRTKVQIENIYESNMEGINIYINNEKKNQKAETSYYIYNFIKKYLNFPVKINIFHNFDLPVGCGYGASGSGALGAAYGLNYVLDLNFSNYDLGKIAHVAEVINRTGLGTVCGQLCGGLCMLKEPGYPCVSESIEIPKNLKVICGTFGMIHTKEVLNDPLLNVKIKKAGKRALIRLIENQNIQTFMKVSLAFVKESEILDILNLTEINELLEDLNKLKILGASMNQLGRSVYAICKEENEEQVLEIFNSYHPKIKINNLYINEKGLQILKT